MKKLCTAIILYSIPLLLLITGCSKLENNSTETAQEDIAPEQNVGEVNYQASNFKLNGNLEKALEAYRSISKLSKSNQALNNEANTLMTLGRFEEAYQLLKAACDDNSSDIQSPMNLCDYILCLTALKKYKEALRLIEQCNSDVNKNSDITAARAICLVALNRDEEALLRLQQACRENADPDARIYYLRSLVLKNLKKDAEAKRILNIATLIYPTAVKMKSGKNVAPLTTPLYADCADLYLQLGRPDRALQTISLAEVLGERSVRMSVVKALAQANTKQKNELETARRTIETERQFWLSLSKR